MKVDFSNQILDAAAPMGRLSQRQQIVASNLANIDTPGYRTKDISFHATMQELLSDDSVTLQTSRPGHAGKLTPMPLQAQMFEVPGLTFRADLNNVDIDREMLKLSETAFGYSVMSQFVRAKLRTNASSIN
jgi:flagellar basal-body rod protein FlgB